jgi:hypothetical protein
MTTVSVFGGTGFLGRRLVRRLAAEGATLRIAVRSPDRARSLLRAADLDRVTVFRADVHDQASVAAAVAGVDAVVNAVSAYVEKPGVTFESVHEQGARTLAQGGGCRCRAARARLRHQRRSAVGISLHSGTRSRRTRSDHRFAGARLSVSPNGPLLAVCGRTRIAASDPKQTIRACSLFNGILVVGSRSLDRSTAGWAAATCRRHWCHPAW